MTSPAALRLHAIYAVLNDLELLRASVRSIYDSVDGITITSGYDRDWKGAKYREEGIVDAVLSREFDPERKVELIVAWEPNESRARNRAMDYANPPKRSRRVSRQHSGDRQPPQVDYFWIVDADEIYERECISNLVSYVDAGRKPFYQVPALQYFQRWNYRVAGYEWFTAFVRSDKRVGSSRDPYASLIYRLAHRVGLPEQHAKRRIGLHKIPTDVGHFHHGSYVGPRERISVKVKNSSHADKMRQNWLEEVYDNWTLDTLDFHPVEPRAMASAEFIPTSALPVEIRRHEWPAGYLVQEP